jgi:CPA1 family monovalent cation:H+ antiporter
MGLGIEAQALWLLIIAAAVAMFTKYIRLPYTIALVVVGIVMGALDLLPQMLLTPELVFHIFLPILLFEAAFNIDILDLQKNARSIAMLALPGVLLATTVTAVVTYSGFQLSVFSCGMEAQTFPGDMRSFLVPLSPPPIPSRSWLFSKNLE